MRQSISYIGIHDLIVIDEAVHHIFQGMYALGTIRGRIFPCDMGPLGLVTLSPDGDGTLYTYLCRDPDEMDGICKTLTNKPIERTMSELVMNRERTIKYALITKCKLIDGAKAEVQIHLIHVRLNQLLQTIAKCDLDGFHRYEILPDRGKCAEHRGNKWIAAELNYL